MRLKILLLLLILALPALAGGELKIDRSRARNLNAWKPQIQAYSKRHYGEDTWQLEPACIVLHYTAGRSFPWNLVQSGSFDGETPGLASHYVVDGTQVWEILPPNVRSRGAYGINHRAVNIEMVASDAGDLAARPQTLKTCARLVRQLMAECDIPQDKIYSHQAVSHMDPVEIPEVKDLIHPEPYGKIDPGDQNMCTVLTELKKLR